MSAAAVEPLLLDDAVAAADQACVAVVVELGNVAASLTIVSLKLQKAFQDVVEFQDAVGGPGVVENLDCAVAAESD